MHHIQLLIVRSFTIIIHLVVSVFTVYTWNLRFGLFLLCFFMHYIQLLIVRSFTIIIGSFSIYSINVEFKIRSFFIMILYALSPTVTLLGVRTKFTIFKVLVYRKFCIKINALNEKLTI